MKIRLASNNDLDFILNMYNQIWEERENNIEELRNIVKSVISNKDSDIFIVTINENDIATFTLNYRLDLWSI
jgi:precorrin-3B methylase